MQRQQPAAPAGLYRVKPAAQRMVRPLVDASLVHGVSADALTLGAIPVAALGGLCLALSDSLPVLLLAVPILAAARLVLNLIDGQVARETGTTRPMGELLNELGDRVSDLLFIGGLAFVAAVGPALALAAVVAALLSSYAGVAAKAAGGPRQYGGIMSKPGRMITLSVAAPLAFLAADGGPLAGGGPLAAAAWIILVGALITLVQRLVAARAAAASAASAGEVP